jgi:hypothetical protein
MNSEPPRVKASQPERFIKIGIGLGILGACVFGILGFVAWGYGHWVFFGSHQPAPNSQPSGNLSLNNWGNYGSYLQGTTASLWSLAGLFVIFVAFLAQKQQLIRQDVELEEQRRRFQLQHESIKQQNFENSFFQLLSLHNQIVSGMVDLINFPDDLKPRGRACFDNLYGSFRSNRWNRVKTGDRYLAFYDYYQGVLGPYFRNLYHIIKFVKNSDVEDKKRYTSLVRATLSQCEQALLFYNCLSPLGEKFKPLVEEFGLLDNLDRRILLNREEEKHYYPKAFQ